MSKEGLATLPMSPSSPTAQYSSMFSLMLVQLRSLTLKSPASEYTWSGQEDNHV